MSKRSKLISNVSASATAAAIANQTTDCDELKKETCDQGPSVNNAPLVLYGTQVKVTDCGAPDPTTTKKSNSNIPIHENINTDCMLLADTTLECAPLHLRQMLQHFDVAKTTQAEILFILIYIIALESGYVSQREYSLCTDYIAKVTPINSYNVLNVLRFCRQRPTYTSDAMKLHFSMQLRTIINREPGKNKAVESFLTAFVTGDFMIVTLTPDHTTETPGFSKCLSIGRYVLTNLIKGKPMHHRFRKLDELSSTLRDSLFHPVRNQQLVLLQVQVYPSLVGLPNELYTPIFQYLTENELLKLANVNKHLRDLVAHIKVQFKKKKKQN